jgi:succinoglycan biosynthesis transport protein ExoP
MAVEIGRTISLRDLLQVLFRRKQLILGVLAFVVGVGAVYTLASPKTYVASSKVLIKLGITEPIMPASKVLIPSVEDISSEMEIIKSNLLIKDVVQEFAAARGPAERDDWSQAINAFRSSLNITPIRGTGFVQIHFSSSDPAYAAKAVNTLTDVYLEKRGEIYQISGALDFIRAQTTEADDRLRESQEQLQAYQREKDVYALQAQTGSMVNVMSTFEIDLQKTNVLIAEKQQQIGGLGKVLTPEGEGLYLGSSQFYDASVDAIKSRLAQLELDRNTALQTFRPDSRKIQALDAEIAMARQSLTVGQRGAAESQLQQAEIELSALIAHRNAVAGHIAQAKAEIRELEQKSYEFNRLSQLVQSNEASYQTYLRKQEEARMSSAIDKSKLLNVGIAEYASVPDDPVAPRTNLNMMVALVVGLIAAFGAAFTREFFDTSLNDPGDVLRELELPTLASVPDFGSRRAPQLYRASTKT